MSFESKALRLARTRSAPRCVVWTAFAATALSLFATGARAGEAQVIVQHKVVNYADLDLSRGDDAAVLYTRLRFASDSVCGQYDIRDLRMQRVRKACAAEALSNAVADVDAATLTALHASKGRVRVAQRRTGDPSRT